MAEGRMLSRKIGRDPRIAALSLKARILWMACISVQEHGGILPRDAHELRMDACPDWADITDQDMESAILEWFIPRPTIVEGVETENGVKKLRFIEFYICNENLRANAYRQRKFRQSHKVTLRNVTNVSNGSNERSEVKGSEVNKRKKNTIYAMPPTAPEVADYAKTIGFEVDAERFCDYYSLRGWTLKNGVRVRDWRAAVRTWKRNSAAEAKENDPRVA